MKAALLHGPKDMRLEDIPEPREPGEGEILLKVSAVGICGSDLHQFQDMVIGTAVPDRPIILGHEFSGTVAAVGPNATDGLHNLLQVGARVAVDPCSPCWKCEMCEKGHPNLCPNHTFYGLYPEDGALREYMIVNARNCFPIPDAISDGAGTLLETLGVAIHATDLAKIKVANSVAVIGAGPVGLLIIKMAQLSGANPIYAFDCHPWRVQKALDWGATEAYVADAVDPVATVMERTNGRGVDVAIEAAWADHTVQQSVEMARHGGRLVLVGIPSDDRILMKHSVVRRKGLTIMMCRRMKHTYPRAIQLATNGMMDLDDLISHHFSFTEAQKAFDMNLNYAEGVHKIILDVTT